MYVPDGLLFQATVSCRVKNSSPLRFRLNSAPREAAYERISEVTTSGRTWVEMTCTVNCHNRQLS